MQRRTSGLQNIPAEGTVSARGMKGLSNIRRGEIRDALNQLEAAAYSNFPAAIGAKVAKPMFLL